MTNRPLEADEIVLLRAMVEADEVASSQGLHDETFAVALLNGGVTFLDHKGLAGERPLVSRRAVLGLREAGLFVVVSETRHLLRVYLAPDARQRLAEHASPTAEPRRADSQRGARRPGRPGWTDELFRVRYQEAIGRATPPYTDRAVAPHFDMLDGARGTEPDYLRKLVRKHGLPPE